MRPLPVVVTASEAQRLRAEGRELYWRQPRTVERVRGAAQRLDAAARALADDWELLCEAVQAWTFLAEYEAEATVRAAAARAALGLARQIRERRPEDVAGHYWYALSVGLLANADPSYGLDAVSEMESALQRAIELDERYDYAGPLRVYGVLLLRTPAPPLSIGSRRKALKLLQRAVELFPDYPENYLYLAEALREVGRTDEMAVALQKVLTSPLWADRQFESQRWKEAAAELAK